MNIFSEFTIILLLLVANGIFAMTEIAVVSSKKAKLRARAEKGDRRARQALELAESPKRFLSTVQVGITLVGIVAGAYGGAKISEKLAVQLQEAPVVGPYAKPFSFAVVVLCITYLSLVIGELVPKRIGLSHPEKIAALLAGPMNLISWIAKPLVWLLTTSSDWVLRVLRLKEQGEACVSEEEVQLLVKEGLRAGVLPLAKSEMLESVLALDKLCVRDLMTPRPKIIWIQQDDSHDVIWHKIVVSGHTSFPVYDNTRDQVTGMVTIKAIYAHVAAGIPVKIKDLMTPALVVPASQNALKLLDTFKSTGKHAAMALDEYGSVVGMVTMNDLLEAIVGDFPSMAARLRPTAKQRDDGSWLVDAMIPIDEFEEVVRDFVLDAAGLRDYSTFAGFIMHRLGRVPQEGEALEVGNYTVEIIDMDHHRIDKVLLLPRNRPAPSWHSAG